MRDIRVRVRLGAEATWLGTVTVHPDPAVTIRVAEVEVEVGETEPVSWNVSGRNWHVHRDGIRPSPGLSPPP